MSGKDREGMISIDKFSVYILGLLILLMFLLGSEIVTIVIYLFIVVLILLYEGFYLDKLVKKILIALGLIVLVGFINLYFEFRVVNYSIGYMDIVKDIWYFSRPIFLIFIGYNLGKKTIPENIIKLVLVVGIISAGYHYIQIIQFGSFNILDGKKQEMIMGSSFIESLLLSILIIRLMGSDKVSFKSTILNSRSKLIMLTCFIAPSAILYLSRSMIVVIMAMLVIGLELYRINLKSIAFGALGILGIVYISMLESTDVRFVQKIQRSASEIGINTGNYQNRLDDNTINAVWRGYEAYRAVGQIIENNKFVWFWGEGLGSKVDLKIQKKLNNNVFRFISRLHNGYVMVLFKFGLIGLFLYLYVMYKMTLDIRNKKIPPIRNKDFLVKIAQGIGFSIILISIVISGLYNGGSIGMLVLIYSAIIGSLSYDGPYEATLQDSNKELLITK